MYRVGGGRSRVSRNYNKPNPSQRRWMQPPKTPFRVDWELVGDIIGGSIFFALLFALLWLIMFCFC